MVVYLDSNFCCHVINDGTMREIETDYFKNQCQTYIEGYRLIPYGESWISPSGITYEGLMISPCIDYTSLAQAQAQYELDMASMSDMQQALNILGVTE